MKNLYLIIILFMTAFMQAQIVTIPDANFKDALVNTLCVDFDGDNNLDDDVDTNDDGEIQVSEALAVPNLMVTNRGIISLDGIESFTNITRISCGQNNLTNLDLSQNPNLQILQTRWNNLTSIDVTQNPDLSLLWCSTNQLTSLDVSQNPNLTSLFCGRNLLTSLDVSQNLNLEWFTCDENQLTNLDVSFNTNLELLECSVNQLTSLDVSKNTNLVYLLCSLNPQLTDLNVKNNNNLNMESLCTIFCENLECIEVDDPVYANDQSTLGCGCTIGGEGWCKDSIASYSDNCSLGLEDYDAISFVVFPNPAGNVLKIESNERVENSKIYSLQGQLIRESSKATIDVSTLSKGLYFVKVSISGKTMTNKFIKS